MHLCPKQILLEKAIAVLLRETPTIVRSHLWKGNEVIEHHKPADPWIAFGLFGRLSLHPNDLQDQFAILLEMQVAPATRAHVPALGVLLVAHVLGWPMGFLAFALKKRTIFGAGSPFVEAHPRTVELAITFEAHQDTVAQLLASPQERGGAVPPIGHHDDPAQAKEAAKAEPTFAAFAERYMADHAALHKKPSTVKDQRSLLRCHLVPAFGRLRLSAITPQLIERLQRKMAATPRRANYARDVLAAMFTRAAEWELVPEGFNPARRVRKFKESRGRERFLSCHAVTVTRAG